MDGSLQAGERNEWTETALTVPGRTGLPFAVGLFFSFRVFGMLLCVRLLGTDPQIGTGVTLAVNFLLLMVAGFQCLGASERSFRSMLELSSVRWVLIFLAFSGCSLLWSVAASLPDASAYWCAMLADVGIVALVLGASPEAETVYSIMKGYVWGACAVAIIAWILPAQSDLRLGDDELLGANQIGYLCGFALFFAQYLLQQKVGRYGAAVVVLGVTLLRSISKTTIIACVAAEAVLLLRDKAMSRRTKLLLVAGALAAGLALSGILASYLDSYASAGNSPETLTGRIGIWGYILDEALKTPWVGHGFYSVWKVIPPFGEFEARHAHNELLQQFYLYGVAGLVLMAGLYGSFYRQVRRFAVGSQRSFFCALLLFVLIRGLADTEICDFSLPLWAILMFSLLLEQAGAEEADLQGNSAGGALAGVQGEALAAE